MIASAPVVTRPSAAAAAGRSRPTTTTTRESMPRSSCSRRSPSSRNLRDPVSARGILDSYRSAQQAAAPPPAPENNSDLDDEGGEACPVGCVTEITKKSELSRALAAAEARGGSSASSSSSAPLSPGIVVVDFYKTACGACKCVSLFSLFLLSRFFLSPGTTAESGKNTHLPSILFSLSLSLSFLLSQY